MKSHQDKSHQGDLKSRDKNNGKPNYLDHPQSFLISGRMNAITRTDRLETFFFSSKFHLSQMKLARHQRRTLNESGRGKIEGKKKSDEIVWKTLKSSEKR